MKKTSRAARFCLYAAFAACTAAAPAAQSQNTDGLAKAGQAQHAEVLLKAKALYAEASYAEALEVLGTGESAEAHQYRALCYLALGKLPEAERSLEALINVAPAYTVSESELPPRLVSLFTQTRRRVMPGVARRLFSEARDEFQAKKFEQARGKFEQVLALTRDPIMAGAPDANDLEVLSAGYLDIVKSSAPPSSTTGRPTVTREPVFSGPQTPAVQLPTPAPPVASGSEAPAATPAATPSSAAAAITPPRSPVVLPAVTIRQDVPAYTLAPGAQPRAVTGAVRVIIGVDGKVKAATMDIPIDPRYDARVKEATRNWLYKPAMRGGEPVESEKVVTIHVGGAK